MKSRTYYASVEWMERSLDPLTTNLVVADKKQDRKNNLPRYISLAESLQNTRSGAAV